jgi:glucokinase
VKVSNSIGVDVGGTKILAGLVDEAGHVLATARRPTPAQDPAAVLAVVAEVVRELMADSVAPVVGVGLGIAGQVENTRSTVLWAPNLQWRRVEVRAILESELGVTVIAENDANAAAWGEFTFGAGADVDDLTVVTVGTGIGGGVIVGGMMLRGATGGAAEIGHITLVPDGRECGCGRLGCWEQYCSGSALVRQTRELAAERPSDAALLISLGDGTIEGIQGPQVTQAALAGDLVAIDAFRICGEWLGMGLADLTAVLDPAAFVISGGVCEAGDLLLAPARATLAAQMPGGDLRPVPQVRVASLGNDAGLIGAADIARRASR